MRDFYTDEEFAPIAAAIKELPYHAPSATFADDVMARVRIEGRAIVPSAAPVRPLPVERRAASPAHRPDIRRSIPARIAAAALVASLGVTMATVTLFALFNVDLLLLVSRVFGSGTASFLTAMVTDASATATATASGAAGSLTTAAGAAVAGSFVAGVIAATAGLRAAASASRKAA